MLPATGTEDDLRDVLLDQWPVIQIISSMRVDGILVDHYAFHNDFIKLEIDWRVSRNRWGVQLSITTAKLLTGAYATRHGYALQRWQLREDDDASDWTGTIYPTRATCLLKLKPTKPESPIIGKEKPGMVLYEHKVNSIILANHFKTMAKLGIDDQD